MTRARQLPRTYLLRADCVSDVGVPGRAATSVLVQDGLIRAVGTDEVSAGVGVPEIRLGGRFLSPGFVDPHAHVEVSALASQTTVDCRFPTCRTIEEVLDQLRDNLHRAVDGWLVGQANLFWNSKLAEHRFPTRQELDSVSSDIAIVIRAGGHVSILNTKAFELSGVAQYEGKSAMYGKAVIERDCSGALTGMIAELDAALPLPHVDPDTIDDALQLGVLDLFTRFGVTTVGEISDTQAGLLAFDRLIQADRLPVRISLYLWTPGTLPSVQAACDWRQHLAFASPPDRLGVRGVKIFADGGYSSANAALLTPYADSFAPYPGYTGDTNLTAAELDDALHRTRSAGLQLAVHANGEAAQALVCAVAAPFAHDPGAPLRIEHAGNVVTDPGTTDRWRTAGAQIMPTPTFLYIGFGDYIPDYMGEPGEHGRFPFRRLLDEGWNVPGCSDTHLGADPRQTNPLFAMWCSIKRETFLGAIVEPGQAVTLDEAWRMHTLAGAIALGREDEIGSIEVGKRADLIVLDRDPHSVPVDELPGIQVDHVLLDGALGYTRDGVHDLDPQPS